MFGVVGLQMEYLPQLEHHGEIPILLRKRKTPARIVASYPVDAADYVPRLAVSSQSIAVFLGGTSVFGGTGSIVGSFVASYIIGAINAGIVSAGINAFYTQLCFGLLCGGVAGNLIELYARMVPGADLEFRSSTNSPSLLFDGVAIAGQ